MEILRRKGSSKAKIIKGKYGAGISRGEGGFKPKNLPCEGYGYFLEHITGAMLLGLLVGKGKIGVGQI